MPSTLTRYPPGYTVQHPQPGDVLLLCAGEDAWTWLIRFGQRLRYRGERAQFARWNHAALFVDDLGTLIEALSSGVTWRPVSEYAAKDYVVINSGLSPEDRAEAVAFAVSCLHDGYGWLTILSVVLWLLTSTTLSFGLSGQEICSGLVASALEHGGVIFPRDASHLMPADLAAFYDVR